MSTRAESNTDSPSIATQKYPLRQAGHLFPGDPSSPTMARWHLKGVLNAAGQRVRLLAIRSGGRLYVDQSIADRFLAELNAPTARADFSHEETDTKQTVIRGKDASAALEKLGF